MPDSESLRRELAAARRSLMGVLRLNGRLARLRMAYSSDESLPSAQECRQWIEARSAEYLAALSRYRVFLEKALLLRPEPIGTRRVASRRSPKGLHPFEMRPSLRSNSVSPRRKRRVGDVGWRLPR
jgi:ribonucleotide reductase alpha subunit